MTSLTRSEPNLVVCGLPGSGKTTFLAALWHLVTSREVATTLSFESLNGDQSHLNTLASRWRMAEQQDRTSVGSARLVSMKLKRRDGASARVQFPDLSGEIFRRMWEDRQCDTEVVDILRAGVGMILFVHADTIRVPRWTIEDVATARQLGIETEPDNVPWHPSLAPTQVQLVDLLQLLRMDPLEVGKRRLVLALSAWDTVRAEGRSPLAFLSERMPLLHEYLVQGRDEWTWQVYGVSAQGGDLTTDKARLRAVDLPSERIELVSQESSSHDLTEPVAWLIG